MKYHLTKKEKQYIRENLMRRAKDPEAQRLDLELSKDFFFAESEAMELFEREE